MPLPTHAPKARKSRCRLMNYELRFRNEAKKEWDGLGATVRAQFKKKLAEMLENPHVPSAKLYGATNRYKIKLRSSGYRPVYDVRDAELIVSVFAIGKRERKTVYRSASKRRLMSTRRRTH